LISKIITTTTFFYYYFFIALDHIFYNGESHVESVFGSALVTCVPASIISPIVRKNIPVLGFCIALDCYHVFSGRDEEERE
jgi:hypothetical protein